MTPKIFEEALLSTARIACCAGLVGLSGCQEKDEETTAKSDDSDQEEPVNVPDEPNFEECMDAIDAGFADATRLLEEVSHSFEATEAGNTPGRAA